jgi:hypothetical protein
MAINVRAANTRPSESKTPSWFDPKISFGHLLTVGTITIGLVISWTTNDNRISALEKWQNSVVQQNAQVLDELKKIGGIQERMLGRLEERDRIRGAR